MSLENQIYNGSRHPGDFINLCRVELTDFHKLRFIEDKGKHFCQYALAGGMECGQSHFAPLPRAVEVKGYAKRLLAIFCHRIHWL